MTIKVTATALVAMSLVAAPAVGQETVRFHGYGEWSAGATDDNNYLSGSRSGDYQNMTFGLTGFAFPTDRLRVGFLVEWQQEPGSSGLSLESGFAEWTFTDALRARAGKSRLPFGLYAETLEVGTLRPFFSLPQGFYGPAGIISDGYDGVGIVGEYYAGGWGISYDAYGGSMRFEDAGSNLHRFVFERAQDAEAAAAARRGEVHVRGELAEVNPITELLGGRVMISAPLHGLTIGGSVFTGMNGDELVRHTVYAPSLSYVAGPIHLRSEWVRRSVSNADFDADAWYVEGAVRVIEQIQLASRYEWFEAGTDEESELSQLPELLEHKEIAFGLNVWFNSNFVVKGSYHLAKGNFFAGPSPQDLVAYVDAGVLDDETQLAMLGVQFSF